MASTPPRQDGVSMGSDSISGKTHFSMPGAPGVGSQVLRPVQPQGRFPTPQFAPNQTAGHTFNPSSQQTPGFPYRPPSSSSDQAAGQAYRPSSSQLMASGGLPPNQAAPPPLMTPFGQRVPSGPTMNHPSPAMGPPLSSSSFGQTYQRTPTPSVSSMVPSQPYMTGQTATPYVRSSAPVTFPGGQTGNTIAAASGPFVRSSAPVTFPGGQTGNTIPAASGPFATAAPSTQIPSLAAVNAMGSIHTTQQGVSGPFSPTQRSMAPNQFLPPGSVQSSSVLPPPLPGVRSANQAQSSQYVAGAMGSSMPSPFPPSQASNQMNSLRPNLESTGSFFAPPKATTAAPFMGPPVSAPVPFNPPPLPSSTPLGRSFPGQLGSQGPPQGQGFPSGSSYYPPTGAMPGQASSFGQIASQSSQYPQYAGGPPSVAMDGHLNRATFPYAGAAPFQNVQGLVEEFQSLSMVSGPGPMESSVDVNALPRPTEAAENLSPSSSAGCHGRYFRLTCSSLPSSQSLATRWHLPLGAVSHPLAQAPLNEEVPVIDFGSSGIIRCRRCRTYINPFAVFTDNGRRWKCNLCSLNNEVPSEYYCPLDQTGRRTDADERPELSQGSVEFIAPAEYMVRPPMPPVYFFLIDVSFSAVKTGMLQIAADTIKSCLDKLPGYPRTQIGFLTFDSTLHFYSLKSTLTQPQMMVVADLEDPFLPMPDDLLVNLSESRSVVESLLNSLPSMFKDNLNVESAVGPALRTVFMIMSQLGGKLLFFQSSLPSLGVGRLKIRGDDPRVYGTDKESSLRNPEDPFYKQMAADFSKVQISVNLYSFGDGYMDLASLGTLAKYTAGQIYHYPSFQPQLSGEKFNHELARDLTRETAWEAVLRIRCGKGMRFSTYHGHFMLRSSDLMALPAVDCDKAFAMQLTLEETLLTTQTAYFQSALLYTSSNGERRIRVHTIAAPLVSDLNEMYRSADTGAIIMLLSRLALEKSLVSKLDDVRQQIVQGKLVRALQEYQNMFGVQHPVTGRLIYPESLKLLPLYCLALYKCLALRGGYVHNPLDERLAASFNMMVMSIPRLLTLLYPAMFRLDECLLKSGMDVKSMQTLPLTAEKLDSRGAFLINDGSRFLVWLGSVLPVDFSVQLLGMEAVQTGDFSKAVAVERDNDLSKKFISLLKSLRYSNPAVFQQCHFVRQGDQPREGILVLFNLVEDRIAGSIGYAEWMVQLFRQVKQKT